MIRAVAVVGPTGSGKTALAIALARRLNTDIISVDSMQCYRGMEIGTAAPTPEERALVKHHFVSVIEPDADMAAGVYQRLARAQAAALLENEQLPVLAGGSGLYLSAFVDGLFEGPARDPHIRERLRAEAATRGNPALFERLCELDPTYAAQLTSPNDLVRIVRALEVLEMTGRPFSDWHREHQELRAPWPTLQVALDWDRDTLYERINHRVDAMIAGGWIEETKGLIAAGYEKELYRLKALGYRELAEYLRGRHSLDDAVEATKRHHRRYAKKQLTWFRADKRIFWLRCDTGSEPDRHCDAVLELLETRKALNAP